MPLHIKDQAATDAVRRLARARKLTLTDAVRIACQEALERDERARPIAEWSRPRRLWRSFERSRLEGDAQNKLSVRPSRRPQSNQGDSPVSSDADHAPARRALLLIDFQRDFLEPARRMPVARAQVDSVLSAAARAMAEARDAGDLIVAIGNEFRPGDILMNLFRRNASILGSEGASWTDRLPLDGATYFPNGPEAPSSILN